MLLGGGSAESGHPVHGVEATVELRSAFEVESSNGFSDLVLRRKVGLRSFPLQVLFHLVYLDLGDLGFVRVGRGSGSQVVVLVKGDQRFAAIFEEGTHVVGAAVSGAVFGEAVSVNYRIELVLLPSRNKCYLCI